MSTATVKKDLNESIAELAVLSDDLARQDFLKQNRQLHHAQAVERLCDEIPALGQVDPQRADNVAQAACWLAQQLNDDTCRAHSLRATGHVLFIRGRYSQAWERYQTAIEIFEGQGKGIEVGRTLSSSLQTLIYLGRYDQAFAAAEKAEEIFVRYGQRTRLARLRSNLGNVFCRLDRFEEALESYQRAHEELGRVGEPQAVAAVLHNLAVCYISLHRFPEALNAYQQARAHCESHNLPLLGAQADYNIAYLHYLRGDYTQAIELYRATRELCDKLNDGYHKALCDLDQSDMYLELNLSQEGGQLAQQAFASFEEQGMGYEMAKALANLAIAASRQGKPFRALELFARAREQFARDQNRIQCAIIDLCQALLLDQEGRLCEARRLCEASLRLFTQSSSWVGKAARCELLLARLNLKAGELAEAEQKCLATLERLEQAEACALSYEAYFVLGQVHEAKGDRQAAYQAYVQAHHKLRNLRGRLQAEELKAPCLKSGLGVCESLVWMCAQPGGGAEDHKEAFIYMEQAKLQTLADLIAFRAYGLPAPAGIRSELVEQVRSLREELNWYYRQIDLEEIREENRSPQHIQDLRQRTRECEGQLVRTLGELRAADQEFAALLNAGTVPLTAIRSALPAGAMLLEYYPARDTVYACLLDRDHLEIIPLTPLSRVRSLFRLLEAQWSKFRHGPDPLRTSAERLLLSTQEHLRGLYAELIAPFRDRLAARHLIVVPHDFLHYLPFHALFDGERYLLDDYAFSYAPSASVYYLCCQKEINGHDKSLILGVSDQLAPHILKEVQAVASAVPNPQLFLGEAATEDCLRAHGATSRLVHIVTPGLLRRENAMFSSIRFANSRLALFELYSLNLSAELVTLSGCSVGLDGGATGDELLGLQHGLLYAGAQAILLPLWDVKDKSTAKFMRFFYEALRVNPNKAVALQRAMRQLRKAYPHPYYWSRFALIGKTT